MSSRITESLGRVNPDRFVIALVAVVLTATLLPCRGQAADAFHGLGVFAISLLFFLQGARLSRDAIIRGLAHWRLHLVATSTTFIVFPVIGVGLSALFPTVLPPLLWTGVLFTCALPSTVQSSIALTSIADGNVAAAVCSATISSVAGIILAPLLSGMMSRLHGGGIDADGIYQIILQLLVPFAAGHVLRPWIASWAARHRAILSATDRSSILRVVYTAFSAAAVNGTWHQLPPSTLAILGLIMALLLAIGLLATVMGGRALGLCPADEVAAVFCGSQKSLVVGVPMASALAGGVSIGPLLLPIMIYYPLQLAVCASLARRFTTTSVTTALVADGTSPAAISRRPALSSSTILPGE